MNPCAAPRHDEPADAAPHAHLCRPCTARLRSDLRRLPFLHAALADLLDPRRAGPGTGSGDGLPYHEPASECMSQIAHDLRWWTELVAELRLELPADLRIPALAGWLHGQVQWASFRPWSGDMAAAFAADRGRAVAILNPRPVSRFGVPGKCPHCGAERLEAAVCTDPGDQRPSVVSCGGCGREWDATQWMRLGKDIISSEGRAA